MKKFTKLMVLVMAMSMVLVGCGNNDSGGGAADGKELKGTYFTVNMPGDATKTTEEQDMSQLTGGEGDVMTMSMYTYPDINGEYEEGKEPTELYAVIEVDWAKMVDVIKENDTTGAMKEPIKEMIVSQITGGSADGETVDLGGTKAIKIGSAGMAALGMDAADGKAEMYLIVADQAVLALVYAAQGDNFKEDSAKSFAESFKAVNLTNDYMSVE